MIARFDHAVIAVRSIPEALEAYASLGFEVAAGGRHPSFGTQNAIVRFGLDYLELLAVEDPVQARARGPFGAELAAYLEQTSGLIGFVLASSDLDEEAAGLKAIGQAAEGPFAMDRERPDGRRLAWRLVIPGGSPWRKPWPFLIEWETPDAERIAWDSPGRHPNGAIGVAGVELLVDDIAAARQLYESAFGLGASNIGAAHVDYAIGSFLLQLHTATSQDAVGELTSVGPGPHRLLLRRDGDSSPAVDLDIDAALGARIRITGL
ncbi:MAG: catechol 2,3-dioxygenase-like lactoylglutathione lyase family enzyme [Gammaproteobacteria bacterium]|jgi:catechol 2,3-dioxygenase-like lactoylglutathione lyase family enzyme